jgi:hypothetical protein
MLLLIRFPVTDKPTRRADRLRPDTLTPMNPCKHRSGLAIRTPPCHDGPARNRVAGGHMRMSAILSRHRAKRDGGSPSGDGGTPPTGGYLQQARIFSSSHSVYLLPQSRLLPENALAFSLGMEGPTGGVRKVAKW